MSNVLVDSEKRIRAEHIVALINGRAVKNEEEANLKNKYGGLVANAKVDKEDVLEYVYSTLLGGLVRTDAEQKVVEEKVEEIKKEGKKGKKGK